MIFKHNNQQNLPLPNRTIKANDSSGDEMVSGAFNFAHQMIHTTKVLDVAVINSAMVDIIFMYLTQLFIIILLLFWGRYHLGD